MSAMPVEYRQLTPADAAAFQSLRLGGLRDSPTTFASSYEEERDLPIEVVAARLAPDDDHFVLGAFAGAELAGCIGLQRQAHHKQAHKAYIWGMYVAPAHRGRAIGRELLARTLQGAEALPAVRQITLCVNQANTAAVALYEAMGFRAVRCGARRAADRRPVSRRPAHGAFSLSTGP